MSTAQIALLVLATACSSSKKRAAKDDAAPVRPPVATIDAGEIPVTCVPAAIADRGVAYVRTDGPRATICYGDGSDSKDAVNLCRVIDEAGTIAGARTWDDAMAARKRETGRLDPFTVTIAGSAITVCSPIGARCKSVKAAFPPLASGVAGANLDGSRVFVFGPLGQGTLYDVATGAAVSSLDLKAITKGAFVDPAHVAEATFLGDKLIVSDRVEVGPEHQTFLVDSHKAIAIELSETTSSHIVIDADTIVTVRGRTVGVVDVASLATVATVTVPGALVGNPNKPIVVTRFGGSLLVAYAKPAGTIAIDLETRTTTPPRPLPPCR
jgi:hypothetical protein